MNCSCIAEFLSYVSLHCFQLCLHFQLFSTVSVYSVCCELNDYLTLTLQNNGRNRNYVFFGPDGGLAQY